MFKKITVRLSRSTMIVFLFLKIRYIYSVLDDAFRKLFKKKPILYYLELDVVEHCNLNCKGCSHFCNLLQSEIFTDLSSYQLNIKRMSALFHNIKTIRLLGGEPLLHKDLAQFLLVTRDAFPRARIYLVTNGLLLFSMPQNLIEAIKETNVKIQVSLYKPMFKRVEKLQNYLASLSINFSIGSPIKVFNIKMNLHGNSDAQKTASRCATAKCQYLSANGFISKCPMPYLIKHFNAYFNKEIPTTVYGGGYDSINIHGDKIDGFLLKKKLNKPMKICSYCTYRKVIPWEQQQTEKAQLSDFCVR